MADSTSAQQPAQLGVAQLGPASFQFDAMRPLGSLTRLPRSLMFRHPHHLCKLDCCTLTTTYSQDPKWKGDRELFGVELKQAQLAQQRSEYSKVFKRLLPIKAGSMSSFGGQDFAAIEYPALSVGAQLLQQVDYGCFVGASKEQLDERRTQSAPLIHPSTLPRLKSGSRPYEYHSVNFNAAHLKVSLPEWRFDESGERLTANGKPLKTRGSTTSWDLYQKVICCLTAGQVVSERKDILTGNVLATDVEVQTAFEAITYYTFKGVGKPAFKYADVKDAMRAFYDEATKPDSSFTTETHLRDEAEKLWQKSISYNANCDNKSQKYYAALAARKLQAKHDFERAIRDHNKLHQSLKRVVAELKMDSIESIKKQRKDEMIRWHSVIANSHEGLRISGEPIDRRDGPGNKKARAEAIFHDVHTVLGHAIEENEDASDDDEHTEDNAASSS